MTSKTTSLVVNSADKIYPTDTHDDFTVDVNLGSFVEPDDERYFVRVDAVSAIQVVWGGPLGNQDDLNYIIDSLDVLCPSMPQYQSYNTSTGTESQSLTMLLHDASDSYNPGPWDPNNVQPVGTKTITATDVWKKTYEVDPFMLRREVVQNKRWRFRLKFVGDPIGTTLGRSPQFTKNTPSATNVPVTQSPGAIVKTMPWQMRITVSK